MERWDPWNDFWGMSDWFDRQRQSRGGRWPAMGRWTPQLDVLEGENDYRIRLSIPGVRPEDVQVTVEQNVVTVSGELRQQEQQGVRYLHQEHGSGHFTRSIALPGMVDADQTQAQFEHGILTITLPKHEATRPRRISVQTQGSPQSIEAQTSGSQTRMQGQTSDVGEKSGQAPSAQAGTSSQTS
jgi:HSP20 family protein